MERQRGIERDIDLTRPRQGRAWSPSGRPARRHRPRRPWRIGRWPPSRTRDGSRGSKGAVAAEQARGERARFDIAGRLPVPALPGGRWLGGWMAQAGMWAGTARDRARPYPRVIMQFVSRMIRSFRDKDSARLAARDRVRRFEGFERAALRKLAMLDAAAVLDDLRAPPGNRLGALRGDRAGQHSVRINDQRRI